MTAMEDFSRLLSEGQMTRAEILKRAGALGVGLRHLRTWLLGRRLGRPGTGGLAVESSVRAVLRWTLAILVASAVVALPLSREIWG